MFNKRVDAYPLCAWLLCAMYALIAQYAAPANWLVILLAGVGCTSLCWCNFVLCEGQVCSRKWYCIVQLLFLIIVSAMIAGESANTWPTGDAYPIVPLVLLAIATFSAWHGGERASRVAGVVFWFIALLFAIVLAAGSRNIEPEYLVPELNGTGYVLLFVFLFPVVTTFLPREGATCYTKTLFAIVILGTVISVLTVGALSGRIAGEESFAFYTFSKSLSLFGVAERFEALVSVALTMGEYSLLSLLLSCAGHLVHTIHPGQGRIGVASCAICAASLMVFEKEISADWIGVGALLFWGILPLIFRNTESEKKHKKIQKNT